MPRVIPPIPSSLKDIPLYTLYIMVKYTGKYRSLAEEKVMLSKNKALKKVIKDVKHLKKIEKNALAICNQPVVTENLTDAGTVTYLFPDGGAIANAQASVAGGDAIIKRQVLFKHARLNMILTVAGASVTGEQYTPVIRVIIVQDWANKAAIPAVTDILNEATVTSPYNETNRKRFSIKYDKFHSVPILTLSPAGLAGTEWLSQGNQKFVKVRLRLPKNKTIEYLGQNNDAADAQIGQLFLLAICDSISSGQAATPSITYEGELGIEIM